MKRSMLVLFAVCGSLLASSVEANAAGAKRYPPRYQRGTFFPTIVEPRRGQLTTKRVYPGYKNGFPPPAWLYYGYPHSGDGLVSPGF